MSFESLTTQPTSLIEAIRSQENRFDSNKAKQVMIIVKDWVKYGGNLYDHLTGKNLCLEKGVDYTLNAEGAPDMASFREARQKKIDDWLNEEDNQSWFLAGPVFEQAHKNEISYEKALVNIRQSDGTLTEKRFYQTPYFYQEGWVYFESNHFNETTKSLRQPERESSKYRVYLNVPGAQVVSTFQEIIDLLSADEGLQKMGFQVKTADVSKVSAQDTGRLMHQKDRIILYLGERGMERALPILQAYAEKNRQKFTRPGVLFAQPLKDEQQQEIPGISFSSETKGRSPDAETFPSEYASFSTLQSMIIESSFRLMTNALRQPETLEKAAAKYPIMKERLSRLLAHASQGQILKAILEDPQGEELLLRNLQNAYPRWAKAYGMSETNTAFMAK